MYEDENTGLNPELDIQTENTDELSDAEYQEIVGQEADTQGEEVETTETASPASDADEKKEKVRQLKKKKKPQRQSVSDQTNDHIEEVPQKEQTEKPSKTFLSDWTKDPEPEALVQKEKSTAKTPERETIDVPEEKKAQKSAENLMAEAASKGTIQNISERPKDTHTLSDSAITPIPSDRSPYNSREDALVVQKLASKEQKSSDIATEERIASSKENILPDGSSNIPNSELKVSSDRKELSPEGSPEKPDAAIRQERQAEEQMQRTLSHKNQVGKQMAEGIGNAGHAVKDAAVDSVTNGNDDASCQALQTGRKYKNIIGDLSFVADSIGAKGTAQVQAMKDEAFASAASRTHSAIESGSLSMSDLSGDTTVLRNKLENANFSKVDIHRVVKNRDEIQEMIETRNLLMQYAKNEQAAGRQVVFGSNAKDHEKAMTLLRSDKYFDTTKTGGMTKNMIRAYFANSSDPMLRKLNPATLSKKELDRLIKNPSQYGLSKHHVTMLKTLRRTNISITAKAGGFLKRTGKSLMSGTRYLFGLSRRLIGQIDDVAMQGARKAMVPVRVAGMGVKGAAAGVRLIGKIPPIKRMRSRLRNKVKAIMQKVVTAPVRVVRKGYQTFKATAPAQKVATAVRNNQIVRKGTRAVSTVKSKVKTTRKALAAVGSAVKVSKVGKAVRKTGKGVKTTWKVLTAPIKAARKFIGNLTHIGRIVKLIIGIVILLIILVGLLVMMISAALLAAGTSGQTGYYASFDLNLKDHVEMLNQKNLEKYQEAFDIALSAPEHDEDHIDEEGLYPDEAHHGVYLYHYGSPKNKDAEDANIYHNDIAGSKTTNGYHIYYLDSQGNIIGQQTSNTKDILSIVSVMVNNYYDQNNEEPFVGFMEWWFDTLNPEPTYQVSDLYDKEGSDKFPYSGKTYVGETWYCNHDSEFWGEYDDALADKVKFYEEPEKPAHAKGCEFDQAGYDSACAAYESAMSEAEAAGEIFAGAAPDPEDFYYCPGHEALSCSYGYRDINVYVTVLTKDDVYAAADTGVITYKTPANYECTEWDENEVKIDVPSDYDSITEAFREEDGWKSGKYQDWCDMIYCQDWYDLYGIDPYGLDSVTLSTGEGALSQDQIDEMIERLGNVSEARQAILDYALQNVGKISYYYGGHASVTGFDGNGFGTIISPDAKGRNKKGLDCAGFVSWVYWTVMSPGSPMPWETTANFVPNHHCAQISHSQLRPGDIGMKAVPGAGSNHIGFYAGIDPATGQDVWVHCSSSGTVVRSVGYNGFSHYYQLFND